MGNREPKPIRERNNGKADCGFGDSGLRTVGNDRIRGDYLMDPVNEKTKEGDQETYCAICRYYKNHRCQLWQVAVPEPDDSHCESFRFRENEEQGQ